MEKTRVFTITKHVKYNDGTENCYLERVTPDEQFARELMQSVFDDADKHRDTKFGTFSNPEWLDAGHDTLRVLCTCYCGYLAVKFIDTYYLSWTWLEDMNSNKIWIND